MGFLDDLRYLRFAYTIDDVQKMLERQQQVRTDDMRSRLEGVGGAPIYANTEQDVIDFVFNPELIDRVPTEAIERVAATKSAIREGEVDLPRVIVVEGEVEGR